MAARAQRIYTVEELHKIAGMDNTAVRSEITGAVPDHSARQEDARECICTYTDPRIGLGILQEDIISWLELLYQIVFQEKSIRLRLHDSIFYICNLGDHHCSLARKPLYRYEILRNSLMQVFGLTHIYHIPLSVIISVDTGGMWK